jgi:hypothetical protein
MAASFSATAVATNWLTLIPSCLARRSTSALTERGRRSDRCSGSSCPDPPDCFGGCQQVNSKSGWRHAKISLVERHDRCRLAVDGGFEDELVGGIAQLWPPHEMGLDRLDHGQHRIDKDADLGSSPGILNS